MMLKLWDLEIGQNFFLRSIYILAEQS